MSRLACAILVVAKAPVAGEAKTRLAPRFTPEGAADLAAAALLDTLAVVRSTDVDTHIVALTGDLTVARRGAEIETALADFTVIPQKGQGFSERLVNAHIDAAAIATTPVLQIGMDTPQVSPVLLRRAAAVLIEKSTDVVFGPAIDGGWWALGVSDPAMASVLNGIRMSRDDTGARTLAALLGRGLKVFELPALADIDRSEDVWRVARDVPTDSQFHCAVERHRFPPTGRALA
ncbi:MAG TPA: DUF2064 domain-containing protein [Acidimicrobiales bacterium]|nr:DUF2064 domain-containing protein [Acidimicrobiales bacterium]